MKVSIIGGGSTYVPLIVEHLERFPQLSPTFSLFDTNLPAAESIARLLGQNGLGQVGFTDNLAATLDGADIVILLFRAGPGLIRSELERIALDHHLLAQETQGICGFFSALLGIKQITALAPNIRRYCPEATVIVLTNPTGIITAAAQELDLRAVGICELPFGIRRWLHRSGIGDSISSDLPPPITYLGLNHFGWMTGIPSRQDPQEILRRAIGVAEHDLSYVPPSIPIEIARESHHLYDQGLANPYIGFLSCRHPAGARATVVSRTVQDAREAIAGGDMARYHVAMSSRGGYLVGDTVAELVAGLNGEASSSVVCSRSEALASRFGVNAAFEFAADFQNSLAPTEATVSSPVSPAAAAMISLVATYESSTVLASLNTSVAACNEALILNPFIGPGPEARAAFRAFTEGYAPELLSDQR